MTVLLKHVKPITYSVDHEAYRIPMKITSVREYAECTHLQSFPLCQRCLQPIEREHQSFCNHCGQALDWNGFTYNNH